MPLVRAAGAVVLREHDGRTQVLAVHRPKYDDWTLPKGKLDPGESFEDAAVREVLEETGVLISLTAALPESTYRDRDGREKVVRWWAADVVEERPRRPDDEVDEVRWIPVGKASKRLTYEADHALVDAALDGQRRTVVLLVRHARAGSRDKWSGPDHLRPLSGKGRDQAHGLVDTLSAWRIDRILSSPYTRCIQTVEPLSTKLGLQVEQDDRLEEGAPPQAVASLLLDASSKVTVWCTHGDVMADLVLELDERGLIEQARWEKGCTWVLEVDPTGTVTAARHLPPPGARS